MRGWHCVPNALTPAQTPKTLLSLSPRCSYLFRDCFLVIVFIIGLGDVWGCVFEPKPNQTINPNIQQFKPTTNLFRTIYRTPKTNHQWIKQKTSTFAVPPSIRRGSEHASRPFFLVGFGSKGFLFFNFHFQRGGHGLGERKKE